MSDRGSTTANHYDHVHVSTYYSGVVGLPGLDDGTRWRSRLLDQRVSWLTVETRSTGSASGGVVETVG